MHDLFKADTETFIREIEGPNKTKVADAAGLYIAQVLRERSFARQIVTPRQVTRADLQVSTVHDQLIFIDEIEVDTPGAMIINFKAEPDGKYINPKRYEVPIFEVATPIIAKKELELLAYTQPVLKVLEENLVREIEATEDQTFLSYSDAAAAAADNLVTYSTGAGGSLTKGALKQGFNLIERNRLMCNKILMSIITFNDFYTMTYQDLGSDLLKEVMVEGYRYYNLGGKKLIVSIKDSMFQHPSVTLASGEKARMVYFYAEEKALGRFIVLDSTKFGARKVFSTIEFTSWEYIGMQFGNYRGVARVALLD